MRARRDISTRTRHTSTVRRKWKKLLLYFGLLPLALLLFYIFSAGPVIALLVRFPDLQKPPYEQALETFYAPLDFMLGTTDSLDEAFDAYCMFWINLAMTDEERQAWDTLPPVTNTNPSPSVSN